MISRLFQRRCSPIAIDVGGHSIKMLQLSGGRESWSVEATAEYALPAEAMGDPGERRAAVAEGLAQLMDVGGFTGRAVVSSVPEPYMRYKNVRLPRMEEAERAEAARWEASERLELGEAAARVEHLKAGEVRNGEETRDELILMAALERDIDDHTRLLLEAGLRPIALEPTLLPLMRCFGRTVRRQSDQREPRVIVDLGAEATKVLIVRDGAVMFFKKIEIGGRSIDRAVAEHLGMEIEEAARLRWRVSAQDAASPSGEAGDRRTPQDEGEGGAGNEDVVRAVADASRSVLEELAQEIALCLRYFSVTFRGKRPDHAWLTGGGAHDSRIRQALTEKLEASIHVAEPFEGIDLSGPSVQLERRGRRCEWAVAVGLAMRPAASGTKEVAA